MVEKKKVLVFFIAIIIVGIIVDNIAYKNVKGTKDEENTMITPLNHQLSGDIWYVPDDFPTIQEAINAANPGDTVFVRSETYCENLVINKSIQLLGENKITTTIDGADEDNVVDVSAGGVTISGFTIRNSSSWPHSGMKIYSYSNNTITNNIVSDNYYGMRLEYSSNNNYIADNTITDNNYRGIFFYDCSNNTVAGNTINSNAQSGIFLRSSSNNTITGNTISSHYKSGIGLELSSKNNTIVGNTIQNCYDGINLDGSDNNNITNNTLSSSTANGITLYSSSNNTINGNTLSTNNHGIDLTRSSSNPITGNTISDNGAGMVLSVSTGNTITGNSFVNDGFIVMDSYQNTVANNYVNGKPLVYLEGESDIVINDTEDVGQVVLVNCTNITIQGQDLSNTSAGVELWCTYHCLVTGNIISNNSIGVYLRYSGNNAITGNTVRSTISWDGISIWGCSNNIITDNTVSSSNWYGIYLTSSNNNVLAGNNISTSNMQGIHLRTSDSNSITGNTIADNSDGIFLLSSRGNTITDNTISTNRGYGIWPGYGSCNNIITENTVSNNPFGIVLTVSSDNNRIFHNNLINNDQNAYDACSNIWDNDYPSGGNYWDDYDEPGEGAYDNYHGPNQDIPGGDGIVDTPYDIPGDSNQDRYPLMSPWGSGNQPPVPPYNPFPENGATNVSVDVVLSWTCEDPDPEDTVTYDVYLGTSTPPPKIVSNQSETTYDPGELAPETAYYWRIVAWDNHQAHSDGPIWEFITESEVMPDLEIESLNGGLGATVVLANTGNSSATDVVVNLTIENGWKIFPRDVSKSIGTVPSDDSVKIQFLVFGIGLGILTDMPTITVSAECAERVNDTKIVNAKVLGPFIII